MRRAKVVVRPVHCEVHAAAPIGVAVESEPTPEAAKALMEGSWDAVVALRLAQGGSGEPGVRDRPPLRERARLPERLRRR